MSSSSQFCYSVEISSSSTGPQLQFSGFTTEQAADLQRFFEARQGESQGLPLDQCFPVNQKYRAVHIRSNSPQEFRKHFLAIANLCDKLFQEYVRRPNKAFVSRYQRQLRKLVEQTQSRVEWIECTIPAISLAENSAAQSSDRLPHVSLGPNPPAPLPIPLAPVPAQGSLPLFLGQPSFAFPFPQVPPLAQNFAGSESFLSSFLLMQQQQQLLAQNNFLMQNLMAQNLAAAPQLFASFSAPPAPQLPPLPLPSIQNPSIIPQHAPLAQSSPPLFAPPPVQSAAVPQPAPPALPLAQNPEESSVQYPYLIQIVSSTEEARAFTFEGFSLEEEEEIRRTFERATNPEARSISHCQKVQKVFIRLPEGWQKDECAIAGLLEIAEACSRAFKSFQNGKERSIKLARKEAMAIAERHSFSLEIKHKTLARREDSVSSSTILVQMKTTQTSSRLWILNEFGDAKQRARRGISEVVSRLKEKQAIFQGHANYFWEERNMMIEIEGPIQQMIDHLEDDLVACRQNLESGIQQAQEHGITLIFTAKKKQGTKRHRQQAGLSSSSALHHPDAAAAPSLRSSNLLVEHQAPANPQQEVTSGAEDFLIGHLPPPADPNQETFIPPNFATMELLPPLADPSIGLVSLADPREEWELGGRELEQQPHQQGASSFLREDDEEDILGLLRNVEE